MDAPSKHYACDREGCTVGVTGICLESHAQPADCPHAKLVADAELELLVPASSAVPEANDVPPPRKFHSGRELGLEDAAEIMRTRYVHLIGVIGFSGAGKTCFLSSIYLEAFWGKMKPRCIFAGSLTLQGFEERVRRLRVWPDGRLADKLIDRTQLQDPRYPSFMHLALHRGESTPNRLELLFTDLPGEWFETLVNRAETADRMMFLQRADGIIFVIDGQKLADDKARHVEVQNASLLLERLTETVGINPETPLALLISRCDLLGSTKPPVSAIEIKAKAEELGFTPLLIGAAAVSPIPATGETPRIKAGTGIIEALEAVIACEWPRETHVGQSIPVPAGCRAYERSGLHKVRG